MGDLRVEEIKPESVLELKVIILLNQLILNSWVVREHRNIMMKAGIETMIAFLALEKFGEIVDKYEREPKRIIAAFSNSPSFIEEIEALLRGNDVLNTFIVRELYEELPHKLKCILLEQGSFLKVKERIDVDKAPLFIVLELMEKVIVDWFEGDKEKKNEKVL